MRHWIVFGCVALAACSSKEQPKSHQTRPSTVDAAQPQPSARDLENATAPCVTEDLLREANASEEDIRQFKKDEAKAASKSGAKSSTCG
jgi:hypothetical protein